MSLHLSFREQAAIALRAAPEYRDEGVFTNEGAVVEAQSLADACCAAWGHEESGGIGSVRRCRRCGASS